MESKSIDELLGSKRRVARIICGPVFSRIKKFYHLFCRKERSLQIHNLNVNFIIQDLSREEIDQMIMDNHGSLNIK